MILKSIGRPLCEFSTSSTFPHLRFSPQFVRVAFASNMARQDASDWNASQYLKFGDERTRAVRDLLAQVPLESPKRIIDLGCGPGNSTAVLAARYPNSHLAGMDSSPDMLEKARAALPDVEFSAADLSNYEPTEPTDLLFSNAVFHWLPAPERLRVLKRLIEAQPSGGVFAFQVPDNLQEPSHRLMTEVAREGPWAEKLSTLRTANDPFQSSEELYNHLKPICSSINIWHSVYHHVLENHEAIVQWVMGTGLRPFIDPLPEDQRAAYLQAYLNGIKQSYSQLNDGKVILRYPRLFVVAVRA